MQTLTLIRLLQHTLIIASVDRVHTPTVDMIMIRKRNTIRLLVMIRNHAVQRVHAALIGRRLRYGLRMVRIQFCRTCAMSGLYYSMNDEVTSNHDVKVCTYQCQGLVFAESIAC